MDEGIKLFGFLILTMLGLTVPVVAILLSVFQKGIANLASQYESERSQAEKNIQDKIKQMAEAGEAGNIDVTAVQRSLDELKSIEKAAKSKLSYLNPKKLVARLFISIIIALCGVFVALVFAGGIYKLVVVISVAAFVYAIYVMWRTMGIMFEAKAAIDADERRDTEQITGLLSGILAKVGATTAQYFLERVSTYLDGTAIKDESFAKTLKANEKLPLKISFVNFEKRMAKRVEVGFIFPQEFIIEKSDGYQIYRDEKVQIVRYNVEEVQGDTHYLFASELTITPLQKGDWQVRTWIKAENIESIYRAITIKVV
ncbi:MAG: hypothetical protein D4S01_03265 [Dehalococcoidia bacterium]|nr:MAG: hypothetical protein D4S01_03265 [Dehalococcoidia bacterium]